MLLLEKNKPNKEENKKKIMRDRKEKDTVWAEISSCGFFGGSSSKCGQSDVQSLWFDSKLRRHFGSIAGSSFYFGFHTAAANLKCNLLREQNIVNIKVSELIDKS